jgi:two-component system chemotaxis response regulator CheY
MTAKRVLSVGQCWADHSAISRTLQRHFGADVIRADSTADAVDQLRQKTFDLVLVNRVFDADGTSGLKLVQQLKQEQELHQVPVMLVSNYEDAQQEAVSAGAVPGFGKAALGLPQMLARVKPFLEAPK